MFAKFFSKNAQKASPATHQSSKAILPEAGFSLVDITEVIATTLSDYRSGNFPTGVLSVSLSFHVSLEENKTIAVDLTLPFPCQGEIQAIAATLTETLQQPVAFTIALSVNAVRHFTLPSCGENIKNIIAIASGKGGVGKSTTTVNLAYALLAEGASVGILDADIYGPSIPTLLGLKNAKPSSLDGKLMQPIMAHGIYAMSIGFLVDENDAAIWRGPMASGAFKQLLNETAWPELDYLLIDMPPGTGDIQLTLAQNVPVAAAVIVTTPQDIALIDANKGLAMFDKVQVPVLGIIENMSYHRCENCGHESHIFGADGGEKIAKVKQTQLLGQLPLDIHIRQDADLGEAMLIENSASEIASLYRRIARNIAAQLFLQLDMHSPVTASIEEIK